MCTPKKKKKRAIDSEKEERKVILSEFLFFVFAWLREDPFLILHFYGVFLLLLIIAFA